MGNIIQQKSTRDLTRYIFNKILLNRQKIAVLFHLTFILSVAFCYCTAAWSDVHVRNDKLHLSWEKESSRIKEWNLRAKGEQEWISLLTCDRSERVLSRHLELKGIDVNDAEWLPSSSENGLMFQGRSEDGSIAVRKRIHLNEINYRLRLQIEIENLTGKPFVIPESVHLILGPGLGEYPTETFGIAEKLYSFVEPIIAVDSKVKPVNLQKGEITVEYTNNMQQSFWCGLHSRYFALLLMPENAYLPRSVSFRPGNELVSSYLPTRYLPELSIDLNVIKLQPRQLIKIEFLIFSGPKSVSVLGIEGTDFSGLLFAGLWNWMRGLSLGVLWVLETIRIYIPSWGVTIIILAILVRLLMYPIAQRAMSSQKQFAEVQRIIQPQIREIKQKFRGGPQSEKILELYKEHRVSPLAGLKPLLIVLIQIPIFIALFHVLGSAFELRDAEFLWIKTLAEPDSLIPLGGRLPFFGSYFNLLPVLLAISTLLTIKLSPAPSADEKFFGIQNIFLILMAIGFFLIFYSFPSGMVLYWTIANVLHILQYKIVNVKKNT